MIASPGGSPAAQYGNYKNAIAAKIMQQRKNKGRQIGQATPSGAAPGFGTSLIRRMPTPRLTQASGGSRRALLAGMVPDVGIEGSPGQGEYSDAPGSPIAEYYRGQLGGGPSGDGSAIMNGAANGLPAPTLIDGKPMPIGGFNSSGGPASDVATVPGYSDPGLGGSQAMASNGSISLGNGLFYNIDTGEIHGRPLNM